MKEPIFISGAPRSGTSILAHLLGKNHNILSFLEPYGLYSFFIEYFLRYPIPFFFYKYFFSYEMAKWLPYSLSEKHIGEKISFEENYPVNPKEYFSSKNILKKMKIFDKCKRKDDYIAKYREFMESILGDFTSICKKQQWSIKQPSYFYMNIDTMYRIHPDMKFILIIRDGRDVVASVMRQPWIPKKVSNKYSYAVDRWLTTIETGDGKAEDIPDTRLLKVRLEDLLVKKDDQIERICSFIGEPYDDAMRTFVQEKFSARSIGRWERDLTKEQVDTIMNKGGHILERYGYI